MYIIICIIIYISLYIYICDHGCENQSFNLPKLFLNAHYSAGSQLNLVIQEEQLYT